MGCEEVEKAVFPTTGRGTGESDESQGLLDANEEGEGSQSGEGDETEEGEDGGVRLPCTMGPPALTATVHPRRRRSMMSPREAGMLKAKEREMVRRVARKGAAFGFEVDKWKSRRIEAVQRGRVVESSFAKGEWGVRWIVQ